jgi:hypothetical protein
MNDGIQDSTAGSAKATAPSQLNVQQHVQRSHSSGGGRAARDQEILNHVIESFPDGMPKGATVVTWCITWLDDEGEQFASYAAIRYDHGSDRLTWMYDRFGAFDAEDMERFAPMFMICEARAAFVTTDPKNAVIRYNWTPDGFQLETVIE